ncbi:hypothetical protein H310_00560 [Aphanomyces invadans]|uniref:Uncharacterized protein n=1 Tax=Aphanomyces invadans TaxID=157072 RepID=A0A024UV16_9STRA|nr:hypothetical protein H310_00560 [Aphanomyces invadans]ETW10194.1 hypothetical protein H310_00560 [Aphanomyces invadans]RHY33646.1 hypothetical protein DYB32_001476 [Aphanomyces invadans]|eukprot:XP_008861605.1 hypothetical protein H310_00560 [Aphanomyces invadans]
MAPPTKKHRTKVVPHSEFVCQYTSKRCDRARSAKKNGQLHRLCEYHRSKANRFQKAYKLRVTKSAALASHDSIVPPTTPPFDVVDPIPFATDATSLSAWNAEDFAMLCDAIITSV